jgi:hypothetical protein
MLEKLHPFIALDMKWVQKQWSARKQILGPIKQKYFEMVFGER